MTDLPNGHVRVTWIARTLNEPNEPDPKYPDGRHFDIARGAVNACAVAVPYPAAGEGLWLLECRDCGTKALVTANGAADDPRSIKLACKWGV